MTPRMRDGHRVVHVANGTSTTTTIQAAAMGGEVSIWADPLYEGPVPAGADDEELLEVRARHLAQAYGLPYEVTAGDLRRWRSVIDAHDRYDELILWFEHDLFDQLNLIQILTRVRLRVPPTKRVSLICIGSFPGRPDFKGLGQLRVEELASLLETRQPVTRQQYDLADAAWRAFREPSPEKLDAMQRADTAALPFLSAALARFLEEYPWTTDGLSWTERRLLQLADGGIELRTAFPRMHDGETAYYVTDTSLSALAGTLAHSSPSLLTWVRPAETVGSLEGLVTLTDPGRAVLARSEDRVSRCGVDRWFGGVHLQGRSAAWRWDPDRKEIRRDRPAGG